MAICPLCDNEQASGDACEVCGRALAAGPATAPATPTIEGLEPTLLERVEAPAARIEGLEPTVLEPPAVELPPDAAPREHIAPWFDRTAHDPVQPELLESLDVEPTAVAVAEPAERAPFSPVTCRYCRTAATPGDVFCGTCGMKLEAYRSSAPPENGG